MRKNRRPGRRSMKNNEWRRKLRKGGTLKRKGAGNESKN